jgi:hypothetical protein
MPMTRSESYPTEDQHQIARPIWRRLAAFGGFQRNLEACVRKCPELSAPRKISQLAAFGRIWPGFGERPSHNFFSWPSRFHCRYSAEFFLVRAFAVMCGLLVGCASPSTPRPAKSSKRVFGNLIRRTPGDFPNSQRPIVRLAILTCRDFRPLVNGISRVARRSSSPNGLWRTQ